MSPMQRTHTLFMLSLILATLIGLGGCSGETGSSIPSGDKDRLSSLEQQVAELKAEAAAREERMKTELGLIRKNLQHIQTMLQLRDESSDALRSQPSEKGDELNQAKERFQESLDRLVDVTKKLLDKMEKEIDEQMKKLAPAPKGEEI